jgi:hypothetical protein
MEKVYRAVGCQEGYRRGRVYWIGLLEDIGGEPIVAAGGTRLAARTVLWEKIRRAREAVGLGETFLLNIESCYAQRFFRCMCATELRADLLASDHDEGAATSR